VFLALLFAYLLSQFFRAFLAVVAGDLARDLGLDAAGLGSLQAAFFLAFASAQIPIGLALDRFGPRRTLALTMSLAVAGAAGLAGARGLGGALTAMTFIGIGSAPVLMTGFYVIGRTYPHHRFATMSSLLLGLGSLGDPISGAPLALAVGAFGWRATMLGLSAITAASVLCSALLLRDPPRIEDPNGRGSILANIGTILRIRALWPILPVAFVAYAGVIATRGLWITPYLGQVHRMPEIERSIAATAMGVAIALGALVYAFVVKIVGGVKATVVFGIFLASAAWIVLGAFGSLSASLSVTLLLALGCFGCPFAIIVAHARSFMPGSLLGIGVTLMNVLFMGGAACGQWLSGRYVRAAEAAGVAPPELYGRLFLAFGIILLAASFAYLAAPSERRGPA
jgi:predicted MFS family arabinose efflux permease